MTESGADAGLTRLSITAAAHRLAAGELTSLALIEAYLRRIDALDGDLNAYATVTAEAARAAAREADARLRSGQAASPLCGVPLGLKDLYDVAGAPTRAGSPLLPATPVIRDSTVAARLRASGAVLLGKQSTHEFAWGGTTNNPHFGPTRNPHDRSRIPGGSSGGSAASVAAGTCAGAFGTDTCGSVRIPAALSGCVGLKPTRGRISLHRVVPLAFSLDHAGPLARTVRDAALLYQAVAGFDAADLRSLPIEVGDVVSGIADGVRGLKVGRLRGWFEDVLDDDVRTAVDSAAQALTDAGASVRDVWPAGDDAPVVAVFTLVAADAVPMFRARFGRTNPGYSAALAEHIAEAPPDHEQAAAAHEAVSEQVEALLHALREVDVLLCATEPAPAPPIGANEVSIGGRRLDIESALTRLTSVFDAAGLPALSVPFARSRNGLPIGVQVVGRHLDEATVLRVGHQLEKAGGTQA